MLPNNMKLTIHVFLIGALAVGLTSGRAAWAQPAIQDGVGLYKVFTTTRDEEVPARDEGQASHRRGHMNAVIAIVRTDVKPTYGLSLYIPNPQPANNAKPGDGFVCNDAKPKEYDKEQSLTCSRTTSSGDHEEFSVGLAGGPFCTYLKSTLDDDKKRVIVDAAGCKEGPGHANSTCVCYYVGLPLPAPPSARMPPNSGSGSGRN